MICQKKDTERKLGFLTSMFVVCQSETVNDMETANLNIKRLTWS